MTRPSNIVNAIILIIILYLFLFQGIISKYLFIGVELIVAVFFFQRTISRTLPLFKKELLFCACIAFYAIMTDILHGELVYADRFVAAFFQGYFISFILASLILKNSYIAKNFEVILIYVGGIAAFITLMAVLYPSFDSMIANINYDYASMLERYANFKVRYRAYGLSENLSFSYPYVLAVIGAYIIMEKKNAFTIGMLLLILISVMFNARLAFIPLLLSIPLLLFRKTTDLSSVFKTVLFIVLFLIVIDRFFSDYSILNNEWSLSFFEELEDEASGRGSRTLNRLFDEMVFLPDENALTLLFGTGVSMFGKAGKQSDIGWVLQTYYGGFILLFMIFFYMLYMFRRVTKVLHVKHWFTLMFIISLLVLNTKGFFIASTPGCRFFTFLYVYYIMKRTYELKKQWLVDKTFP